MNIKNDVLDTFINELVKYNINEISRQTNIHRNTIAGWYSHKHMPSLIQFITVANAIGYKVTLIKDKQ